MMELPRVSTILRIMDDAYAGAPQAALEAAADRGQALHRLCLTYLAGRSVWFPHERAEVPGEFSLAYNSFVQWCEHEQVDDVAIEESSSSVKYGYCGTPDALVLLQGEEVLIELKFTAAVLKINKVQVQAYRKLDLYKTAKKALLLHIHPVTGILKVHPIPNNPHDWAAFLNALALWKWRQS